MDKKELQKQYEKLSNQITVMLDEAEKLKQKIDSIPDKKAERWKPELGGRYFFLNSDGDIISIIWGNTSCDLYRFNVGNCFKTFDEAFDYKENLLTKQQLKDLALELNDGVEIDWDNNNQEKFAISYSYYFKEIKSISVFLCPDLGQVYCISSDFMSEAVKRIGEEKLIKLIKSGV